MSVCVRVWSGDGVCIRCTCMCSRVVCDLPPALPEGWTCSDSADASQRPAPLKAFIYTMFAITQNSLLSFSQTHTCSLSLVFPYYLHPPPSLLPSFSIYLPLLSPPSPSLFLIFLLLPFLLPLLHILYSFSLSLFPLPPSLVLFFSSSLSPSPALQELGIAVSRLAQRTGRHMGGLFCNPAGHTTLIQEGGRGEGGADGM